MLRATQNNWDERQLICRGKGYQYGFLTMVAYAAVYYLLTVFTERQFMTADTAVLAALFLGAGVHATYCILNDAYFTIHDTSAKSCFWSFLILAITNGVIGVFGIADGRIINENGLLTNYLLNNIMMVVSLANVAALMINKAKTEQEEKNDEES